MCFASGASPGPVVRVGMHGRYSTACQVAPTCRTPRRSDASLHSRANRSQTPITTRRAATGNTTAVENEDSPMGNTGVSGRDYRWWQRHHARIRSGASGWRRLTRHRLPSMPAGFPFRIHASSHRTRAHDSALYNWGRTKTLLLRRESRRIARILSHLTRRLWRHFA